MRFFNTAGPIQPDINYCIPPLERLALDDVLGLIRARRYFVLHAPRQTGKTSALLALRDLLNSGAAGDYRCVYANVESGQAAREDTREAMRAILSELASRARLTLQDTFLSEARTEILEKGGPNGALSEALGRWAQADPDKPLVLLLDEIDALVGDTLVSVLRQLRSGYDQRPAAFPQSVVLCGLRDVRDYRIHASSEKAVITGGSAFNIRSKSLRLGDFTRREVLSLLAQHTEETGQSFTPEAAERVWTQTQGQPWLVNALAYEACFDNKRGRDRSKPITCDDIDDAQEALIMRRETHLDQLTDKLQEDRVRRVIEPILAGSDEPAFSGRDLEYVRDLGLIAQDDPVRLANPIYGEVVPRELTYAVQAGLVQETAWYVTPDGGLNVVKLLAAFQTFFREHSEHWSRRFAFQEAWPQLLLQAFLQRIVNGGGRVEREHGLGRRRADLVILWPQRGDKRKFVVELKVLRGSLETTIHNGLEQTAAYMDRCAAESGHLVIVDPGDGAWEDKTFHRVESHAGAAIHVWGM